MKVGIYVRVSTDEQRDHGHSIDSQLRMLNEHAIKNGYIVVGTYNDAGYSGKSLQRPAMQQLIKDIENRILDKVLAIKVDRLTRDNYDGFWFKNHCEKNDVKLELILEPFDLTISSGEMMYGMNLMYGQHERKEIGARTKRALEEMVKKGVHPNRAPFGYSRNKETGKLEINEIEAEVVKVMFEMIKNRDSCHKIARVLNEENYYSRGKWVPSAVHKVLTNKVCIGTFEYRKNNKKEMQVYHNYCKPIISEEDFKLAARQIEKNKHSNYGEHIHLFHSLVPCPSCGKVLASVNSMKAKNGVTYKTYYHLTCKNKECDLKGIHYNVDAIEEKLTDLLDELTRYMLSMDNDVIIATNSKSNDVENIDKAIDKLKIQEKKLVDLYLTSSLDVETINAKNEMIKSQIEKLTEKKKEIDPFNDTRDYDIDLYSKLDCTIDGKEVIIDKNLLSFGFKSLTKENKRELIQTMIKSFEVYRTKEGEIIVQNVQFTEEIVSKNHINYLHYLQSLTLDSFKLKYEEPIMGIKELEKVKAYNNIYSLMNIEKNYSKEELENLVLKLFEVCKENKIINRMYIDEGKLIDSYLVVPKIKE